ncbi:hypothetical protein L210DRAFT_3651774 [Boletus edulis BED1]|uniref:Uncharacterized protein n=1 Tax=Boletus edulis BED1 TaxID=1328754 RepID=A0AAD4BHB6_BOLED|nr:hypothetical protein L210DRAFT_3651774 [Boletus edulis BED1]
MADGTTWIPDIADSTRAEKQALVRAFLTSHYRDVCQKDKASAPFKKLRMFQDNLFLQHHLPSRFVFPDDPSHMTTADATRFLIFIRKRQEDHPEDIFEFQRWLKGDRLMKPGNPDEEGDDAGDSDNSSTEGNTSQTVNQEKRKSPAVDDAHQETGWITGAKTAEGSKSGLKVADAEVQPIGNADEQPIIANEEVPPQNGPSKGKERADIIPGARKRVADIKDPVSKGAGHKRDTAPQPDQSIQASSPPAAFAQTGAPRNRKASKKQSSKGKKKADIGTSAQAANPASAGLDDSDPIAFSMRPPIKSIVQLEKKRLKRSLATRQPTPGPGTACIVKGSEPQAKAGPSNTSSHRQKKTGPLVEGESMGAPSAGTAHRQDQDSGEALHDAYKEVPVVPLEQPDGQSKAAQPNHHKRGPPLRSALKNKAPFSSVPDAHTLQDNSEGPANSRESEIPAEPPSAANNTVHKVMQESTDSVNASKNMNTAGSKPSEPKKREVKRIRHTTADQPNEAQGSPTKWDIEEEPATPPMKMSQGKRPDNIPEQKINHKTGKPSGKRVGRSENTSPVANDPEPETPRRSGRNRRPPPTSDADFKAGEPKAKKRKRMSYA